MSPIRGHRLNQRCRQLCAATRFIGAIGIADGHALKGAPLLCWSAVDHVRYAVAAEFRNDEKNCVGLTTERSFSMMRLSFPILKLGTRPCSKPSLKSTKFAACVTRNRKPRSEIGTEPKFFPAKETTGLRPPLVEATVP